jgi:hypothetical protein
VNSILCNGCVIGAASSLKECRVAVNHKVAGSSAFKNEALCPADDNDDDWGT